MPVLRYQVTLHRDGLLPEDDVVNVWYFDTDQTIAEDADDIADRVVDFYDATGLGAQPWWAATLTGTGTIKVYDMADAMDRPVRYTRDFTFPVGAGALPAELAVCLTFHGDLTGIPERVAGGIAGPEGDTKPRSRRRGRIYLGPFSTQAAFQAIGSPSDVRVNDATITTIVNAAAAMAHGPDPGDGRLAVFSPTIYRETLEAGPGILLATQADRQAAADTATVDVIGGWVDNAWDIQRRRGADALARVTWVPA